MLPENHRSAFRHWRAAGLACLLAGAVIAAEDPRVPSVPAGAGAPAESEPPPEGEGREGEGRDPERRDEPVRPSTEAPPAPGAPEQLVTQEGEVISAEEVEEPDLAELPL